MSAFKPARGLANPLELILGLLIIAGALSAPGALQGGEPVSKMNTEPMVEKTRTFFRYYITNLHPQDRDMGPSPFTEIDPTHRRLGPSAPPDRETGPFTPRESLVDPDRSHWRPGPSHPPTRDTGPGGPPA